MKLPLVIGVGQGSRPDVRVGIDIARRVLRRGCDADVWWFDGPSLLAMEHWADREVVLVDAMRTGRTPGSVVALPANEARTLTWHAHRGGIGLRQALVLAQAMGHGPQSLTVIGVEVPVRSHLLRLDPDVAEAIVPASELVVSMVGRVVVVREPVLVGDQAGATSGPIRHVRSGRRQPRRCEPARRWSG